MTRDVRPAPEVLPFRTRMKLKRDSTLWRFPGGDDSNSARARVGLQPGFRGIDDHRRDDHGPAEGEHPLAELPAADGDNETHRRNLRPVSLRRPHVSDCGTYEEGWENGYGLHVWPRLPVWSHSTVRVVVDI